MDTDLNLLLNIVDIYDIICIRITEYHVYLLIHLVVLHKILETLTSIIHYLIGLVWFGFFV